MHLTSCAPEYNQHGLPTCDCGRALGELEERLEHDSTLSAAQLRRAEVVSDPTVVGTFAVRVPPHGQQSKPIDLLVYDDDWEEVTFSTWPPEVR